VATGAVFAPGSVIPDERAAFFRMAGGARSFNELPAFNIRTLFEPCGVWQVMQSILPSRTGIWPDRFTFIASCLWQDSHMSRAVAAFNWACSDFGL
jgi:hypothetical protein